MGAERVLRKMEEYSSVIQTIPKPNVQIYTLVIDAYAKSYSKDGALKAENLMNEMIQLSDSGVRNILPDNNTLKNVIKAWVRSGAPEAATKANSILVIMEKMFLEGNENLKPDEETYSLVAHVYFNDKHLSKISKAIVLEKILRRMQKLSITSTNNSIRVIEAYCHVGTLEAASKAEQILHELESNEKVTIDTKTLSTLLFTWSNTKSKGAGKKAEDIFSRINQEETNELSVNQVLLAYTNEGSFESVENAENFLHSIDQRKLDSTNYNIILNGFAECMCVEASARAENLLDEMERLSISAEGPQPDTISYNSVIKAWARSGDKASAQKALAILVRMGQKWKESKNIYCKPSRISFNTVMNAHCKNPCKDSGKEAEKILRIMIDLEKAGMHNVEPNQRSYSILIEAYAQTKSVEGATRAEQLLDEMTKNNITPDKFTLTSVMKAWCKTSQKNAAYKAEKILKYMLENHKEKVDRICFMTVIGGFVTRPSRESVAKVKELEKLMKEYLGKRV